MAPTISWRGTLFVRALQGGGCRFRIHRHDSPHRHLSPGAPRWRRGSPTSAARRRHGEDDLRQVFNLCALGGALDGLSALNSCGLRLVGLAGGDDFTVAGFEAEAELPGLVGVDLE